MERELVFDSLLIDCRIQGLFAKRDNYIGMNPEDYQKVAGGYHSKALLTIKEITAVELFLKCLEDEIREVCHGNTCSAILKMETNPRFLKVPDLSRIADSLYKGGALRFRNCIAFDEQIATAHAELFLFFEE